MTTTVQEAPAQPRKVDRLVAHYGESHQNPTNELIHFIAVPLITLSLVGMIWWIHPWAAYAFLAAGMLYYVLLGSPVFIASMALWVVLLLVLVQAMGTLVLPLSVAIFVVSWIFQFIGHKIEGKKPSFFEDLQYLLVGPLFVLSKLLGKLHVRW